jgi:hypothetical protein
MPIEYVMAAQRCSMDADIYAAPRSAGRHCMRAYGGAAQARLCLRLWDCHTGVNAATMEQRETARM